jgi:hypothetical protein
MTEKRPSRLLSCDSEQLSLSTAGQFLASLSFSRKRESIDGGPCSFKRSVSVDSRFRENDEEGGGWFSSTHVAI